MPERDEPSLRVLPVRVSCVRSARKVVPRAASAMRPPSSSRAIAERSAAASPPRPRTSAIVFSCVDHVEIEGSPTIRIDPPTPQVHPRALIRTVEGPPRVALVTPLSTEGPRLGVGARF